MSFDLIRCLGRYCYCTTLPDSFSLVEHLLDLNLSFSFSVRDRRLYHDSGWRGMTCPVDT